jgi:hypothetical protein
MPRNLNSIRREFDKVIIACGTLQSTALIQRSPMLITKNSSFALGRNLMDHCEGFIGNLTVKNTFEKDLFSKLSLDNFNRANNELNGIGIAISNHVISSNKLVNVHYEIRKFMPQFYFRVLKNVKKNHFLIMQSLSITEKYSYFTYRKIRAIYDIIFVSPSNNSEIGGINVLIELANKLADSGFRVGFICLNYDPIHAIQNFTILQKESIKYISETKIVISSGLEVYKVIKELNHSLKFKFINIIQGPEYLMDNKFFEEEIFEIIYKESMFNIVVSPFLLANMGHFEIPNLKLITFGPDSRIFYDDFKVRENKMLISCRKEKSKGTELAIKALLKTMDTVKPKPN